MFLCLFIPIHHFVVCTALFNKSLHSKIFLTLSKNHLLPYLNHRNLTGSPDSRTQYMAIMNSIFAAQKNKVAIDACVLGEDSTFLQQASEITGGTYVRVEDHGKLAQYLLGVFLMGVEFRKSFNTPPASKVLHSSTVM